MEDMKFITKLGRGAHGSVYLFENENIELVACKSIDKKFKKHARREVSILKQISHKNIIRYLKDFCFRDNLMIFMEFANYGTLETLISFFRKNRLRVKNWLAWSAFVQLLDGLSYLHAMNIIHRDIKPSNVLLNKVFAGSLEIIEFKICDFSLATVTGDEVFIRSSSLVGTPYYMAPEIVNKNKYDATVDVWSLGVCMYELFKLKKPFNGEASAELSEEIVYKEISTIPYCFDTDLSDAILQCMKKKERPSSEALCMIPEVYSRINTLRKAYNSGSCDSSIEMGPNVKGKEVPAWPPTPN
eukprot:jgi/Antlo1/1819/952